MRPATRHGLSSRAPKVSHRCILMAITSLMLLMTPLSAPARQSIDLQTDQAVPTNVILTGLLEWEAETRSNFQRLLAAIPRLPAEIAVVAYRVRRETTANGSISVGGTLAFVLFASLLGEWILRRFLQWIWREHRPARHSVLEVLPLSCFVLLSGFLYFSMDLPALTNIVVFLYLAAAVLFRLVWAVSAMARTEGSLSPFMSGRLLLLSAALLFSLATVSALKALSAAPEAISNVAIILSLAILSICLEVAWRHVTTTAIHMLRRKILQTSGLLTLWLLWLVDLHLIFWLGLYAISLPLILTLVERLAKNHATACWPGQQDLSLPSVLVVRSVRSLTVTLAALWLMFVWQYYPNGPGRLHTALDTVVLGLLKSVIVLLAADLGWSIAKVLISRKLASTIDSGPSHSAEQIAHQARLRTLLPIFRNALTALVLAVAALTVLAELGIEVAPLLAGAGIFGVAVGFGSQTLVKDAISGVFYLLDDAFRVGEYIQSGSYMGTVESFSLRSVRLRHHRGAIFTVPFGELGAVQNMSRDWAIDKFLLRLSFDADLPKASKLVKKIGQDLLEDAELGPLIIETLKLKGVEQIGDFGIEVSFTFTAVPGNQSTIRRHAYGMIRKAFQENGIGFAQPTVQVGGNNGANVPDAIIAVANQRAQST
jgi:small-conductance mechanosensitive channel